MKNLGKTILFGSICLALAFASCKKKFEKYPANPNLPGEEDIVPPEFLLRTALVEINRGGGVKDNMVGAVEENVFQQVSRWSQYQSGLTFPLYGGTNLYNWTNTTSPYSIIRDMIQMEKQAINAFGEEGNPYLPIAKFVKAYAFIWYTNRVGDIPMSEAGQGLANPNPKFDSQKDVFEQCLLLLEEANDELEEILGGIPATNLSGDIYYNGDLMRWRKAVNSFTIRILVSLSKRVNDTPELRIAQRFSAIVNDPSKYPVFESNFDQLAFEWIPVVNRPDIFWRGLYSDETTVASTILDLTTASEDPRTFLFATPAPAELAAGKSIDDFTAYVGSDNSVPQGTLFQDAAEGAYSYVNFIRYLDNTIDNYPDPKIIFGYAELCFNIAEGINRGWASGDDEEWYNRGVQAAIDFFGLTDGTIIEIGDVNGAPYGTVEASVSNFLSNPNVVYQGGQTGLEQILNQKYIAFWQTGSWEPYYNWRRTGIPALTVGAGTNPQGQIPLRWQYPPSEVQNNPNASQAISSQYGNDNIFGEMWLIQD